MATLQDRINRIFEETAGRTDEINDEVSKCDWRPIVDIYDTEQGIVINAELPGVAREDITVDVRENILTLKGERKFAERVRDENYYRRERCAGRFERAFTLPDAIDPEKITANFKDGVLQIEIPRPEVKKPKQVTISVG